MKRILLTGFEPFGDQALNPSELLVKALAAEFSQLTTQVLTVHFDQAVAEINKTLQGNAPFDAIVMLGQAGGRAKICLERYAHNWMENKFADLKNPAIDPRAIETNSPAAIMTPLPVEELRDKLNTQFPNSPTTVTLSAGSYVCNHLYFKTLSHHGDTPALFVHVPYLPEQTKDSLTPTMEFDTQLAVIRQLLHLL
ncbi:hypothetical protein [Bdellovibrio sp. HCB209]|uniref:pyroglutamyl-peptidase I family protein n=1 Tax=Bdellovibrio sp. HCB209 TaxID=3394354 RepID=UPI0039B4C369